MKRHFIFAALLLFMFVLSGCPMQTAVSIDNGSLELPTWLKGGWHSTSGVLKYYIDNGSSKGNIKVFDIDTTGAHTNPRKAVLSNIDGAIFISVYYPEDDDSKEGYYLYKIVKVTDREFDLKEIKSDAMTYDASSAYMKEFLSKNKDNEAIYEKAARYIKD